MERNMNNKSQKNKKPPVLGFILILLIVIAVSLTVVSLLNKKAPIVSGVLNTGDDSETEMVYSVLVEKLKNESMENYLMFNGDVIAETSVDLFPDTAGKLTRLYVSLGSYIRKGQIIAEIDPSLPGQVYVASPVRSTISGTITDLPFQVGSTISSSQIPVATVGNLTDLQLVSYIAEKDMALIQLGQSATISFEPFPGEIFKGTVTEISPVLERSSRTLEIRISMNKEDSRIKSGMFGSIRLITELKTGIVAVPNESLIDSAQGSFVYVVENGTTARRSPVKTGLSIDGKTEILKGLSPGDVIVKRGQTMLKDGSLVRISE